MTTRRAKWCAALLIAAVSCAGCGDNLPPPTTNTVPMEKLQPAGAKGGSTPDVGKMQRGGNKKG